MSIWTESDNSLHATLFFADFSQAFAFMTEVALLAEKHDHHPSWRNVWNSVEIKLNTHDAGHVVTDKDRRLAADIEKIYVRYGEPI